MLKTIRCNERKINDMGKFRVFNIPVKRDAAKILFVTDSHAGHTMANFTLPDGILKLRVKMISQ